jgi:hypothetical protein
MDFVKGFRKVFSDWRYLLLAILISLIFYSLNILIFSWETLFDFYQVGGLYGVLKLFFVLFLEFNNTIKPSGFFSFIFISLLVGILFSMILWKTLFLKKKERIGFLSSVGIFLGVLAPGCAACGIGVLSLLGISGAVLRFLPFEGLEISIISILILGFAIWQMGKKIEVNSCGIRNF